MQRDVGDERCLFGGRCALAALDADLAQEPDEDLVGRVLVGFVGTGRAIRAVRCGRMVEGEHELLAAGVPGDVEQLSDAVDVVGAEDLWAAGEAELRKGQVPRLAVDDRGVRDDFADDDHRSGGWAGHDQVEQVRVVGWLRREDDERYEGVVVGIVTTGDEGVRPVVRSEGLTRLLRRPPSCPRRPSSQRRR